jgi:hypothetical protein
MQEIVDVLFLLLQNVVLLVTLGKMKLLLYFERDDIVCTTKIILLIEVSYSKVVLTYHRERSMQALSNDHTAIHGDLCIVRVLNNISENLLILPK